MAFIKINLICRQNTNQDLITTYNELETEACNRLNLLTNKVKQTKKKFSTSLLNEDLNTLLEVIRRLREEQSWSADGLEFHTITCEDVYGPSPNKLVTEEKTETIVR
jgi:predicted house-cleaning noncanonical NTP pyrophosphatase (MazG superfamily)